MASIDDNSGGGSYAYRMSKTALNMFMKCFSLEYSRAIHIALHPGWVQTDMGGSGAPLSVAQSVTGMVKVITGLSNEDSGRFINYKGDRVFGFCQ